LCANITKLYIFRFLEDKSLLLSSFVNVLKALLSYLCLYVCVCVWSGCSPAISLFTKVHIRWLYRACGPHSNIVCHARNTASLSLSLSNAV